MNNVRVRSQGEIEEAIMAVSDALEAETDRYALLCDAQAEAEAEFRLRFHSMVIALSEAKLTAAQREAKATLAAETEYRAYKRLSAQVEATKQALNSYRTRLDALRTLAANLRAQS